MCICQSQLWALGILVPPVVPARHLLDDMDGYLEGLLIYLSIEIRPLVLGKISQSRDCHGTIDVRSLGSGCRSGDQEANTPAWLTNHSGKICPRQHSLLRHHDGVYLQSMENMAQSVEISEFFKILGPALLSASLRALSQGHTTVVLGIGCNHARHRSPAAAHLAAHWLRTRAANVQLNMTNMARVCSCNSCRQGTRQVGFASVFAHCQTAFENNFRFKGRTRFHVRISGADDSGFSRADAHPQHVSPPSLQQTSGLADLVSSPGVPCAALEGAAVRHQGALNTNRLRSRSPRGGHLLPQGDLMNTPAVSSSSTVQPQSFDAVIAAAIYAWGV